MKNIEIENLFARLIKRKIDVISVANVLDCSVRTVYRLKKKYIAYGINGMDHKNKGKVPVNKIPDSLKHKILKLYSYNSYCNSNFTHFSELLKINHNIHVSPSFIHSLMKDNLIYSKKANKYTKKYFKKLICDLDKTIVHEEVKAIVSKQEHFRRERKKNFGQLIQMDGFSSSMVSWC